jgi:hypothetical protein
MKATQLLLGLLWSAVVLVFFGLGTMYILNRVEANFATHFPAVVRALVILIGMLVPYRLLCGRFISDINQVMREHQEKRGDS